MNKFMKSFLIPVIVFFGVGFAGYKGIMYGVSRIQHDPTNANYITIAERDRQIDCLAENVYYESANQNAEGKVLVAQITLNRTQSDKFPNDVCKVIHQKSQFSWTDEKPKALRVRNQVAYNESKDVAKKVLLEGYRLPSIKTSLYYHTKSVHPQWDKNMKIDAIIGDHIAYTPNTDKRT